MSTPKKDSIHRIPCYVSGEYERCRPSTGTENDIRLTEKVYFIQHGNARTHLAKQTQEKIRSPG